MGITAVSLSEQTGASVERVHIEACDVSWEVDLADGSLDVPTLVARAVEAEIDAVHPGFGRHRQRDEIARALEQQGLSFIGQDADAAGALSDRTAFRQLVEEVGGRVVPGSEGALADLAHAQSVAEDIGYPVVLGPAADGDDPSWTVVHDDEELEGAFEKLSQSGAALALEAWLARARAVEVLVAIDAEGDVAAICDREETLFEHGRSLIEECPATAFAFRTDGPAMREMAFDLALRIASRVECAGLLRVGVLVDEAGTLYLSHADLGLPSLLTALEMVTGQDLVGLELQLAAGEPLPDAILALQPSGYAVSAQAHGHRRGRSRCSGNHVTFPRSALPIRARGSQRSARRKPPARRPTTHRQDNRLCPYSTPSDPHFGPRARRASHRALPHQWGPHSLGVERRVLPRRAVRRLVLGHSKPATHHLAVFLAAP